MLENLSALFSTANRHPFITLGLVLAVWSFWPSPSIRLQVSADSLVVKGGFQYARSTSKDLEIYPFMVQKRFLGMPSEAGVSSAVYYVTRSDLEAARRQYEKRGGCWPSTFSSYKQELMIVGKHSALEKIVKHEGPPPLYGDIQFVRVSGNSLRLRATNEKAGIAQQVAASRNSEFFYPSSVQRLS